MKSSYTLFTVIILLFIGGVSSALAGDMFRSLASGTWTTLGTWESSIDGGANWNPASTVPGNAATDAVLIRNGHTVTFNQDSVVIASLTIGEGTSGILLYEATTTLRRLVVSGDLTIGAGAQFNHNQSATIEHKFYLGGNLIFGPGAKLAINNASTRGINFFFNRAAAGDQTITATGLPATVDFQKIIVNRSNTADRVLCNMTMNIKGGNNGLQLQKGTWEQSSGTLTMPSAATGSGAIWRVDSVNSTFKVTGDASVIFTSGLAGTTGGQKGTFIVNTTGVVTFGATGTNVVGKVTVDNGATLNILSGTVNINGNFKTSGGATTISGGSVNIDPQVDSSMVATNNVFEVQTLGTLNMSAGMVTVVDPLAGSGTGLEVKLSGTINMTGGTLRLGNGVSTTSGSSDGFEVYLTSGKSLYNLTISNPSGTNRHVVLTDHAIAKNLTVLNDFTIAAGELRTTAIDASGANMSVGGTWTNNGTFTPASGTVVTLNGASGQSIGGTTSTAFSNLTVNNALGATLDANSTVNGTLAITSGHLDLNGYTLTLGPAASLSETAGNTVTGTSGVITTTRTLTAPAGADIAGLGVAITSAADLGNTVINRGHAAQSSGGNASINRYFEITPATNTGLNATLVFRYDDSELNSIGEGNLALFKYDGSAWTNMGGTRDPLNNTITLDGIDGFSKWTAGDVSAPLPIQLASFTGRTVSGGVQLNWTTLSEVNNYGFYVQKRRTGETNWVEVQESFTAGHGTTNMPHQYTFTDQLAAQGSWQYRLKQVDLGGTIRYTEPILIDVLTDVREVAPVRFALLQNYPNPFNPSTEIKFSVDISGRTTLTVYNILGQSVATLFDALAEAGRYYKVKFNTGNLASGLYFYKLENQTRSSMRKMILAK